MDENTANFLEFWQNYKWPESKPISYRLYYDQDGCPLVYTMEDLPGDYIEVDQSTYIMGSFGVRVKQGKLKILPPASAVIKKLQPDPSGDIYCHPFDVCVIVDRNQPHTIWKLTAHEIN